MRWTIQENYWDVDQTRLEISNVSQRGEERDNSKLDNYSFKDS